MLAAVLLVTPVFADGEDMSPDVGALEEENAYLQDQIAEEEARIADLQVNIGDLESYIRDLNDEMERIDGIINDLEDQKIEKNANIDILNDNIDALDSQIADKELEIEHQYDMMKMRIRFLYENVGNSYIEAIFSSHSFSEAVKKIQYLLEVTNYDREAMEKVKLMIEDVQEDKNEKETQVAAIEDELKGIDELEGAQAAQQEMYDQVKSLKETELIERRDELDEAQMLVDAMSAEISANQGTINALIDEYNARMAELEAEREAARLAAEEESRRIEAENESRRLEYEAESRRIEEENESKYLAYLEESSRIEAENESRRIAYEEESRRLEEEAAAEAGEEGEPEGGSDYVPELELETPTEPEYETPTEPEYEDTPTITDGGSGSFIWPLPSGYSKVTSWFGYRGDDPDLPDDSNLTYHQGIDIYAPSGTSIYAVMDGVVVTSGWSDYIGNYVVIYHGNQLFTEMHHLSGSAVSVGETVSQGQVVGYVGATGIYCYGAHLHFGVSVGNDAYALTSYVDPAPYLGL